MSCVKYEILATYSDMGGSSTWTLDSAVACDKGRRPVHEQCFFTLQDGETFDDVGYKLSSGYYKEARRIDCIPSVGYRFSHIPSTKVDEK